MSPFSRQAGREDIRQALEYAYGSFLRFSAMWALAGFGGAFLTVFLSFSKGNLDMSPLFREVTVGLAAALLGLGHSRYQYFLLENWPGRYATLRKAALGRRMPWSVQNGLTVAHPGRAKVLLAYAGGILLFLVLVVLLRQGLPLMGGIFFAEGGFFFARVLFWKRAFEQWKAEGIYDYSE